MPASRTRYSTSALWADVDPLPQDDGGPNALATIAYTEEYKEAMSYLRAVMAANEFSPRVLQLTEHVIGLNPAHYTVWLYRAKCLSATSSSLHAELTYLNTVSLRYIKNYQIWHHRQHLITLLDSPAGEADFLAQMLDKDAKNYHVWSYRQWLVKHFNLWDDPAEIAEVERFLRKDVRNNSAWNHRWFVVFGRYAKGERKRKPDEENPSAQPEDVEEVPEGIWRREEDFAKDAIRLAPQNESPWNYLRGLMRRRRLPLASLVDFALEFAPLPSTTTTTTSAIPRPQEQDQQQQEQQTQQTQQAQPPAPPQPQDQPQPQPPKIRSSHALDLLADAYAEDPSRWPDARAALDLLTRTYDPIRANYWEWRAGFVGGGGGEKGGEGGDGGGEEAPAAANAATATTAATAMAA